ncbi:hypothetical protein EAF04_001894 [Stromatinia cepivora]|nr:hypothetical protein EAF04_001894 [Stromatinia cepivora]
MYAVGLFFCSSMLIANLFILHHNLVPNYNPQENLTEYIGIWTKKLNKTLVSAARASKATVPLPIIRFLTLVGSMGFLSILIIPSTFHMPLCTNFCF